MTFRAAKFDPRNILIFQLMYTGQTAAKSPFTLNDNIRLTGRIISIANGVLRRRGIEDNIIFLIIK